MKQEINIIKYDTLDSTMDEAKRLIKSGQLNQTTCIVAEEQHFGRGTHGRKWVSSKGSGIYLSLAHSAKQNELFDLTTLYTWAAGIACVNALQEVCDLQISLKPINDLYIKLPSSYAENHGCEYGKLGGILTESILSQGKISALITGVGINIKQREFNLDKELSFNDQKVLPISLEEVLSKDKFKEFSQDILIKQLANNIDHQYQLIFNGERELIKNKWEEYSLGSN